MHEFSRLITAAWDTWCCRYSQGLGSLSVLPRWAQATLASHASDLRPSPKALGQLQEGTTGDAWWDAAQQQLVSPAAFCLNARDLKKCRSIHAVVGCLTDSTLQSRQ